MTNAEWMECAPLTHADVLPCRYEDKCGGRGCRALRDGTGDCEAELEAELRGSRG